MAVIPWLRVAIRLRPVAFANSLRFPGQVYFDEKSTAGI